MSSKMLLKMMLLKMMLLKMMLLKMMLLKMPSQMLRRGKKEREQGGGLIRILLNGCIQSNQSNQSNVSE